MGEMLGLSYLRTVSCDSGQRKEKESILAPPRSCHRHFVEQAGLPHLFQKGKNSEARGRRPKIRFGTRPEADEVLRKFQISCFVPKL